ncbi:MAG: hypothetical protein RR472_09100, partial [Anaerovoracaceae bacterium]
MMPGLKELIGIFFGLLCIFCIDESCNIKGGFSIMVTTLRIVIVGITILCLVELVFGWHLYTSRFSNPTVIEEFIKALGKDYDGGAIAYDATGIFYNVNDLCAFLALFFPLFFPHRGNSILRNSAYILEMILLILIISKDDAWISLLAMGISGVGYLLIRRKNWKIWLISAIAFALIKEFVVKLFYGLVYIVYWLIPGVEVPFAVATMFGRSVSEDGLTAVVSAQLASAKMEKGSAFTRMENYKEGFTDLFTQSGGMGLGPESYNRYMEMKHGYDLAMDPHCFWLEIMFQYGIVVFIAFVALLAYLFFRLVKNYRTTHRREYAVIIAIDLA